MNPQQFKLAWEENGDQLVPFPPSASSGLPLPSTAQYFLCEAGLPSDAAPFLSFAPPKEGGLPTVSAAWGFSPQFDRYFVVGSNGSGDPVVLSPDGTVYYLNHDSHFAECYINKDVQTLAQALLRCRDLIAETQRISGPDAYLDGMVPLHLKEGFIGFLKATDPQSLEKGSMWAEEISTWAA